MKGLQNNSYFRQFFRGLLIAPLVLAALSNAAGAVVVEATPVCGARADTVDGINPYGFTCSAVLNSAVSPAFSDDPGTSIDFNLVFPESQYIHLSASSYVLGVQFNGNLTTTGLSDAWLEITPLDENGSSVPPIGTYATWQLNASGGSIQLWPEVSSFFNASPGVVDIFGLNVSLRPFEVGSTVDVQSFSSFDFFQVDASSFVGISSVPEPATIALFGGGVLGVMALAGSRRRRQKA